MPVDILPLAALINYLCAVRRLVRQLRVDLGMYPEAYSPDSRPRVAAVCDTLLWRISPLVAPPGEAGALGGFGVGESILDSMIRRFANGNYSEMAASVHALANYVRKEVVEQCRLPSERTFSRLRSLEIAISGILKRDMRDFAELIDALADRRPSAWLWDLYPLAQQSWGNCRVLELCGELGRTVTLFRETLDGSAEVYMSSSVTEKLLRREFYIPTSEDVTLLKHLYPEADPCDFMWHLVEVDLVAMGYLADGLAALSVPELLRLVKDVRTQRTVDQAGPRRELPPGAQSGQRVPAEEGLRVCQAARISGISAGVISRAVSAGRIKSNGKKGTARRIDLEDFTCWQARCLAASDRTESYEAVERKLKRVRRD